MIFEKYNKKLENKCGMPKRKSKCTEELQQKYPFFKKDKMSSKQNALLVATELVSGANKGKLSLDMHVDSSKHKKAVQLTFFCSLA